MRVLILGSGAKDHAIAWWFSQSNFLGELFIAPGNVATSRFATNCDIDPSDPVEVYETCLENKIDFVFIGTEAPLFTGVIDYLNERGIATFGAPRRALKLEADRNFARAFTDRHNILTPRRNLFETKQALEKFLVFRLFTDRVNAGGDDPNRHSAFRAGNQQVNDQLMMRRLLSGKREKADQQLRIQQIPFVIGEPEARR